MKTKQILIVLGFILFSSICVQTFSQDLPVIEEPNFTQLTVDPVAHVVGGDTIVTNDGNKIAVHSVGVNTLETVKPFKPVEYYDKGTSRFIQNLLKGKWLYRVINSPVMNVFFASLFGTCAGGLIIFWFQRKQEQTKYCFDIINRIDNIFQQKTGWKRNTKTQKWECCEFRKVIGMASWTEDPCGEDGHRHESLQCSEPGINWEGVVYKIDDNFRVASKPLHDYANWFRLVIFGYKSKLLLDKHIQLLWRSIIEGIAEKEYDSKDYGMKKWIEFFILGKTPSDDSKETFDKIVRIISEYSPAKEFLRTKNFGEHEVLNE